MSSSPLATNLQWVLDATRDPPAYTRPLFGSELSMQRHWNTFDADGEVCIGINFACSMKMDELENRARDALDKLRFVCPIIACTVEDVVYPRWVYAPYADREAWLDLALVVEERGARLDPSQFVQGINLKRLPYADENGTTTLFRAYLLTTSTEGDDMSRECGLYFHGSHTIIDGGPALHALNLMCEWMSGERTSVRIKPSEEWKNLPVDPITATGGLVKEWEAGGMELMREFEELNGETRTAPSLTLAPPSRPLNMSDPPFRHTITLSESETSAIVAEAKRLGVSVSTLFHAAHCLVSSRMNPISETETKFDFISDVVVVSLERFLKPPVNPKTHFISSFTLMPLRFSTTEPSAECTEKGRLIVTAKLIQECFDKYLTNPCLPQLLAIMAGMSPTEVEQGDDGERVGTGEVPVAPWCSAFNNLGVMEKKLQTQHENITIESVCIGNRLRNCITIHMWTMHSKFHFQVQGATAWGEEFVKMLLEETLRIGLLVLKQSS